MAFLIVNKARVKLEGQRYKKPKPFDYDEFYSESMDRIVERRQISDLSQKAPMS